MLRVIAVSALVGLVATIGVSVAFFARDVDAPLERADAIVVLGGEHDGREDYGIDLARRGFGATVVLSDPYGDRDPVMARLCPPRRLDVPVLCPVPDPSTTRGEALFTRALALEHGWRRVTVVTWSYHLSRAQFIFDRCLAGTGVTVSMRSVPRRYDHTPVDWTYVYAYQWGATVKALVQGGCA